MSPVANPRKTSRKAILAAAVEIVERDGTETLSMRAVARRLGLAPNALYYYFRDRKALEAAVAAAFYLDNRVDRAHTDTTGCVLKGYSEGVWSLLHCPPLSSFQPKQRYLLA